MYVGIKEIQEFKAPLKAAFGDNPVCYANVSQTQFSVARYYGGCRIGNADFVYVPKEDLLIRRDAIRIIHNEAKKRKAEDKRNAAKKQETLGL